MLVVNRQTKQRGRVMIRLGMLITAILCLFLVLLLPSAMQAWTPSDPNNPRFINAEEDTDLFYNYDFEVAYYDRTRVDWPIGLVFWGNASVQKVRQLYWGYADSDSIMYNRLYDTSSFTWYGDKGTKGMGPSYITHTRPYGATIYAPDWRSNYSLRWGYYVIATAHYDNLPYWSGYSENAEYDLVTIAQSRSDMVASVERNAFACQNHESYRVEGVALKHIWYNPGGKASKIQIK